MRRDETFTVEQHVDVDVDLPAGSIVLRSGTPGIVSVSVEASHPDSFDIGQIGDTISIHASRRNRSARLVIDMPTGSDVNVEGTSVDVTARGALGALRFRSRSGDLEAEDLVRVEVSVVSGDAQIDLVRNNAEFNTTSGDISVRSIGGRVAATLTSGDLRVGELAGDADVQTASGDVTIGRCDGSTVAVRTLSGSIRLGLPSGIRVDPEISTLSGRVKLPEPAARTPNADRRSVRVRLRSVSGDVRIDRAS